MSSSNRDDTVREEPTFQPATVVTLVEPVVSQPVPAYNYRAVQAVWFLTIVVDALLLIRFVLKLFGASDGSSFVMFMYGVTGPLVAPFRGIFAASGSSGYIFEPAALVAIVVYALAGWGIVALIRLLTAPRGTRPVQ